MKLDKQRGIIIPDRVEPKTEKPKQWSDRFQPFQCIVIEGVLFQVKEVGEKRMILIPIKVSIGQKVEVKMKGKAGESQNLKIR